MDAPWQVEAWGLRAPSTLGGPAVLLSLTLPDPDATCRRMVARGAEVVVPIADRPYAKREGSVRDPFGHLSILSRPTEVLDGREIQRRLGSRLT